MLSAVVVLKAFYFDVGKRKFETLISNLISHFVFHFYNNKKQSTTSCLKLN